MSKYRETEKDGELRNKECEGRETTMTSLSSSIQTTTNEWLNSLVRSESNLKCYKKEEKVVDSKCEEEQKMEISRVKINYYKLSNSC